MKHSRMKHAPRITQGLIAAALFASALALYAFHGTGTSVDTSNVATLDRDPAASAPTMVQVAPAIDTEFTPFHHASGNVISRRDAQVASEQDGRVVRVADVGQHVASGEPLAVLDDTELRLREQEVQAELARIDTLLEQARRQERRYARLADEQNIARAQYEQMRADRDVLAQERVRAAALLAQTRHQRKQMIVRAPFGGVVVEQSTQIGEFLVRAAPVARLVDTQGLEIRTRVPVTMAPRMFIGNPVRISAEGLPPRSHEITAVVPVGDERSRQLEIRVALGNTSLAVGSAVALAIPSASPRKVLAVPRDALMLRREGNYVLRIDAERRAQRIPVRLGEEIGSLVEVDGPLISGDLLVVLGGERLEPGQPVRIEQRAAVAATR